MIWQLVLNGLVTSAQYLLMALGFGMIFATVRFFHFAHGSSAAIGAYAALVSTQIGGLPMGVGVVVAVMAAAAFGGISELGLYRPLRHREATPLILMLASLGLYVVVQSVLAIAFGDDAKNLLPGQAHEGVSILGARLTTVQIAMVLLGFGIWAGLYVFESRSRAGLHMRAVAVDEDLARALGLPVERVALAAFVAGSALAGLVGVGLGLDVAMYPTMGLRLLMGAVVVVIVGGVGSVRGMLPAALLVGVGRQLSVLVIGSQWQDAVVFFLLFVFLLVRPRGFVPLAPTELS